MADLPSSFVKVNDVEVQQDAPVTEALFTKMGSNDNFLKDGKDSIESDISTNVKGPGPFDTMTTTRTRMDSVKSVANVGSSATFEAISPTTFYQGRINPPSPSSSGTEWGYCVTRSTTNIEIGVMKGSAGGGSGNLSIATVHNTSIPNSLSEVIWYFPTVDSTSANWFSRFTFYRWQTV